MYSHESNDINDSDELYSFHAHINDSLCDSIGVRPASRNFPVVEWNPPSQPGLQNSNAIIPAYYTNAHLDMTKIDYFTIIKDDIKNCRVLNAYQMEYIHTCIDDNQKQELFVIYNEVVQLFNDVMVGTSSRRNSISVEMEDSK
jgi:hypothetical protein